MTVPPGRPAGTEQTTDFATIAPWACEARTTATRWQKVAVLLCLVALGASLVWWGVRPTAAVLIGFVTVLYLVDLVFTAWVVTGSLKHQQPVLDVRERVVWPDYTVLCPMYGETAVIGQFVDAIARLDYPLAQLQVLLLLEEDDVDTIAYALSMDLPPHFEIIVVPSGTPQTKPRACNEGLRLARGELVVIFDAEDVPEPDQLKKAVLAFEDAPRSLACLQAPLNFYNARQNVLTRLFTAEYSLWFDLQLSGLQRLKGPIPLGGTSNHFRTEVLRDLGGWDPYNVTEDCDLGIRLYKAGFRTAMLDSTTYEEANSWTRNWVRQRSRWIKGYMQTFLVHLRGGWRFGDPHFLTFLLVVGGKVLVNFVNPVMWFMTASYFVARPVFGPAIESVYPAPVFYAAVTSLVVGNVLFVYTFLLGSARRGNWDLVKYGFLAPGYWLLMSVASVMALWQLVTRPHYWEKTVHGLHLDAPSTTTTAAAEATSVAS
jgi:cellulose synthase/poly-beta-1,6-N-acetylglucosamine synthase-like glycosyltransferase